MKKILKRIYNKDINSLLSSLERRNKSSIITVNPETIILSEEDKIVKEIINNKEYILVPDGVSVVHACNRIGNKINDRITGVDLMVDLLKFANDKKMSIYLLGAKEEVVSTLYNRICSDYKNISLLGYSNGYVKDKNRKMEEIIKLKPDILFVALGIPYQEKLIGKYYNKFKKGIFIGVGGSFDVLSGTKKRAPRLFIKLKLEWLYRIICEPKRLKRFFKYNVKFLFRSKR